jgi:hypothetical protein
VTYTVSGTFEQLSGSDYSALSGGSFVGTFVAPSDTFALAPQTYDDLHDYEVNLYTANGTLFSTLNSIRQALILRSPILIPTSTVVSGSRLLQTAQIIYSSSSL